MISNLINRPLSNGCPTPDIAFHESLGDHHELTISDGDVNTAGLRFGDGGDDSPFSVMGWIHCAGDGHTVFQVYNEYTFVINSEDAGQVGLYLYTVSGTTSVLGRILDNNNIVEDNMLKWTHWACTYDASEANSGIKIYIDGNQVDDTNDNTLSYGGMSDQDGKGYVVDYTGGGGRKGLMSDLAIYNVELSADDIKMIASQRHGFNHMLWNKGSNCKFWTDMNEQYRSGLESYTFLNQILKISDQVEDGAITVNASGSQSLAERWQRFKGPTTK